MKVYLVTASACPMVGIETLKLLLVPAAQEAAFLQQYAGRILAVGENVAEALGKAGLAFKK